MERLKELMSPFFLRREKTVQTSKPASAAPSTEPESNPVTAGATTGEVLGVPTRKVEVIVWTQLTDIQLALYQGFLQSPEVMAVLNETQSPLAALTVLKKISCHPLLLNDRARKATVAALKAPSTVAGEPPDFDAAATSEPNRNILQLSDAIMKQLEGGQAAFQSYAAPTPETVAQLLGMSGKLQFLMTLLESFQGVPYRYRYSKVFPQSSCFQHCHGFAESDNRVLVFSQSKVMLDVSTSFCVLACHCQSFLQSSPCCWSSITDHTMPVVVLKHSF